MLRPAGSNASLLYPIAHIAAGYLSPISRRFNFYKRGLKSGFIAGVLREGRGARGGEDGNPILLTSDKFLLIFNGVDFCSRHVDGEWLA